jgi:hypothetical protein
VNRMQATDANPVTVNVRQLPWFRWALVENSHKRTRRPNRSTRNMVTKIEMVAIVVYDAKRSGQTHDDAPPSPKHLPYNIRGTSPVSPRDPMSRGKKFVMP